MRKFKNIIFDLDGTLIDSSPGIVEAVNYSLRAMGEPVRTAEEIKPFIGFSLSVMYPNFTDAPVEELYRHFQHKAQSTVVEGTTPLPHADEVLGSLAAGGYRMAVASTKVRIHIERIIDKLGWTDSFDCLIGGDEVSEVKPDPEILNLALNRLDALPEQTLVVGDTVNDVAAAKQVPVPVAAVASPYGGAEQVRRLEPDYYLETITQLPDLLT